MTQELLRKFPSIDSFKKTENIRQLSEKYGEDLVVEAIRRVFQTLKEEIKSEGASFERDKISQESISQMVQALLDKKFFLSLRKAVNATGVILHTGLGRAVLPEAAQTAIAQAAEGYSTLATDVETGRRAHRDFHLDDLICELTGAEAATVMNNNAAATMLILNTLAKDREVIVSRGQLVEIGGSFRMPDVMASSGAVMREVGTTNKTHLSDYTSAIHENTAAILRVHHSNYRILGFTSEPSIEELVKLAHKCDIHVIDDLGSGALVDLKEFGVEHEPLVQDSINAGVDAACFSADKLIGGPQAGVIVGKASIINRIRKNPLTRAFRVGKLTIAGLQATLQLFLNPGNLKNEHPIYRMFSMSVRDVTARAQKVAKRVRSHAKDKAEMSLVDGGSQVGSGAVPVETIPTKLLQVVPSHVSVETLAQKLRQNAPPIFTRVHKGAVVLDFRTVQEPEDKLVTEALIKILSAEEI